MAILNEEPTVSKTSRASEIRFALDPIHAGMRLAVFGSFVGTGILTFMAGLLLIPGSGVIMFLVAGLSATGISMGVENLLKDRWQSGREFVADENRIALTKHSKIEAVIDPQQQVNVLTWQFKVKKDGPRAKKGWRLLGLGLDQDDTHIVIYTAVSPDDFETMPLAKHFMTLEKPKANEGSAMTSSSSMRLAGQQKRLYQAEIIRQMVGGDMMFEQFLETIDYMQTQYDWMITD